MVKINNIARNTSYLTLALVAQKVLSFTYFTIIARELGPDDLGKYFFAISFTSIFSIFIDLGLTNVLTREIAKNQSRAENLLRSVMAWKVPFGLAVWAVTVGLANFFGYSDAVRHLIYLSTICMVLDTYTATFFAVSRGFHNLKYESIASVLFHVVVLISGLFIIKMQWGLVWLMLALNMASLVYFSIALASVIFKYRLNPLPKFDKPTMRFVLAISMSFVLYAIFQRIFTFVDSVMLGKIAGDKAVGIYQVAFKIINALQFLPLAFSATIYPAMSTYWLSNRPQLSVTFERAINYLAIVSLPISFGIISIADMVVKIFKAGYADAVWPLSINMLGIIFMFLGFPIGSLLNACDRQKRNTVNMSIVLIFSVLLNSVLIPYFGLKYGNAAIGASITAVISNALMLFLGWRLVKGIIDYRFKNNFRVISICAASAGVMSMAVYFLKARINLPASVLSGGVIYLGLIYAFKVIKKEDFVSIYNSLFVRND